MVQKKKIFADTDFVLYALAVVLIIMTGLITVTWLLPRHNTQATYETHRGL
jgi:hypothetical protein